MDEIARLKARIAEMERMLAAERPERERLQAAFLAIAEAVNRFENIPAFYAEMHRVIGDFIPAGNLYFALYDEPTGLLSYPYSVEEGSTENAKAAQLEYWWNGLNNYVFGLTTPLHVTQEQKRTLEESGTIEAGGRDIVEWLGTALIVEKQVLGVLAVQSFREDVHFATRDVERLGLLARYIAPALDRARRLDRVRAQASQMAALAEFGRSLSIITEQKTMLQQLVDCAFSTGPDESVAVYLLESDGVTLTPAAYRGPYPKAVSKSIQLGEGLTGAVAQRGRAGNCERCSEGASKDADPRLHRSSGASGLVHGSAVEVTGGTLWCNHHVPYGCRLRVSALGP